MRHHAIGGFAALLLAAEAGRCFMPAADPTSWAPMLKETYDESFKNQLAEDHITEAFMDSEIDSSRWEGKKRILPVKIGRNYAAGSIGVKGALPQAGRATWKNFEVTARDTYTRVGFERYVMEETRNKKGAFGEVVATEMESAYEDYLFHRNRMMWGYGSGILCLVNGALTGTGTTVTVDAPGNVAGSTLGNRYLHGNADAGMYVHIVNASSVVQAQGFITAVSNDGTTFDLDANVTCDDNAKVIIAQTPSQNSYNLEPEGILAGVDDGTYVSTYHNLSRTTYPQLKSQVITGVGAFSLDAIQQGVDAVAIRTGKSLDLFFAEFAVRRAYLALLELDRRYTGADLMSPDGGTKAVKKPMPKVGGGKAITYGDLPIFADRDCLFGDLFGINKESWTRYVLAEGEWDNTDGSMLKWVSGFDQWTAFYRCLDNFHCQRPNVNVRWEGIDVNQIIVRAD